MPRRVLPEGMRTICPLPLGLSLVVDMDNCSPYFRDGRGHLTRPHEWGWHPHAGVVLQELTQREEYLRRFMSTPTPWISAMVNAKVMLERQLEQQGRSQEVK